MTRDIERLDNLVKHKVGILGVIADQRRKFGETLLQRAEASIDDAINHASRLARNDSEIIRLTETAPLRARETIADEVKRLDRNLEDFIKPQADSSSAIHTVYDTHRRALDEWISKNPDYNPSQKPDQLSQPESLQAIPVPTPEVEVLSTSLPQPEPLEPNKKKSTRPSCEFLFPDGKIFKTESEKNLKLIEMLNGGKISMSKMSIVLYGDDTPETRSNVSAMIARSKAKLKEIGRKVEKTKEEDETVYGLVGEDHALEPVIEPGETSAESKEDNFGRDLILISLPDGQIAETFSPNIASFIEALTSGIIKSDELIIYVFNENTPANRDRLRKLADKARVNISKIGWTLKFQLGSYELSKLDTPKEPVLAPVQKKPEAETEEIKASQQTEEEVIIRLSTGQEVLITKGSNAEFILKSVNDGITSGNEMAILRYGENENQDIAKNRIGAAIGGLNIRHLRPIGLELANITTRSDLNRGVPSHYVLQKIEPRSAATHHPRTESINDAAAPSTHDEPLHRLTETDQTLKGTALPENPYVPTPEDLRSEFETRVVEVINKHLLKSVVLQFDLLQGELYSEDRILKSHGKRQLRVLHADELGSVFETGIKKLRDQFSTPILRRMWTEHDEKIWGDITRTIKVLSKGKDININEFIILVKRLIASSERTFNKAHPENGKGIEYINL